jgi:hypothetical protein
MATDRAETVADIKVADAPPDSAPRTAPASERSPGTKTS